MSTELSLKNAARILAESGRILAFTGAGISTESGIPDFRSDSGIWKKYDPEDFMFDKFVSRHENRKLYWERSREFYEPLLRAEPNAGHRALVKLEQLGKLDCIVTQNIDGLHHRAGNDAERIIELHGHVRSVSCLRCGASRPSAEVRERIEKGGEGIFDGVPYCTEKDPKTGEDCGAPLKTDTISFGQAMPVRETQEAFVRAQNSDCCVVVGSSLVVHPAAMIPVEAKQSGAALIIINRDPTPMDPIADVVIREPAGQTLSRILDFMME